MAYKYSPLRHSQISRREVEGNPVYWRSLPAEIRLMITETIANQKHRGWASLASVSREWQSVITKRNFSRMKLKVANLDDLKRTVHLQRDLIRRIALDIKLPAYTCRVCDSTITQSYKSGIEAIVRKGLSKLFFILHTWNSGHNLTLELNVYSPSDSDHWFKDFYFSSDYEGNEEPQDQTASSQDSVTRHDPQHGWINGYQHQPPPGFAVLRLFHPLFIPAVNDIPTVDAVTGLIIRRQLRRQISPLALGAISEKLPNLESVIYEPWRSWDGRRRLYSDIEYWMLIKTWPFKSLKACTIFEDFNENLATALSTATSTPLVQPNAPRIVDLKVGTAFAFISRRLEHLSLSHMIEAKDFFQACEQTWRWQKLRSLALTSRLLICSEHGQKVCDMLCRAADTALRMPELRELVIWNGAKGYACAFIYYRAEHFGHITWRGTWNLELDSRVVDSWQMVVSELGLRGLRTHNQEVENIVESHGDAIQYLKLPFVVISPASLWQIQRENRIQILE